MTSLDAIDLTDLDRFEHGFPHAHFTALRREAPVWWHPPTPRAPGGEGFWVVSSHALAKRVLGDPRTFSSEGGPGRAGGGTTLVDYRPGEGPGQMINMTDPPAHTRFRRLVNQGFTPRMIAALEAGLRGRTRRILDRVLAQGACDFVVEVAAELPLQAIAEILGVPQEDRHRLFAWANAFTDHEAGESAGEIAGARAAAMEAFAYAHELVERKRSAPGDDILSVLVHAELPDDDGTARRLDAIEIDLFFVLLITAGSETTRNAIAGGMLALLERPESWDRFRSEPARLMPTAVEEMLRWSTPTAYNRRTTSRDTEVGGQAMRAGEKVTVWYASANRDESVFADPFRFDLERAPNDHLAFGAGPHLCLGASLARLEIRVVFEEILGRVERVERTGDVEWMRTNKFIGMRHMPVRLVGAR
ncbi:MAG: cytochrome P450 [bacterium]